MAVEIITQNDAAVLEARVTVVADSMPLALERAGRELSRYCAGVDKAPAVTESQVITRREIDRQHAEYTVLYGEFSAQQRTVERIMDGMESEGATWVESNCTASGATVLKFRQGDTVRRATIERDGTVAWRAWTI